MIPVVPYVFFVIVSLFGGPVTFTIDTPLGEEQCEQTRRMLIAGINAFAGRGNFAGTITECQPK